MKATQSPVWGSCRIRGEKKAGGVFSYDIWITGNLCVVKWLRQDQRAIPCKSATRGTQGHLLRNTGSSSVTSKHLPALSPHDLTIWLPLLVSTTLQALPFPDCSRVPHPSLLASKCQSFEVSKTQTQPDPSPSGCFWVSQTICSIYWTWRHKNKENWWEGSWSFKVGWLMCPRSHWPFGVLNTVLMYPQISLTSCRQHYQRNSNP